MSVNKVMLIGNLTKDPELKTTTWWSTVVSFWLATSEKYNDEEKTQFHRLIAFWKLAETIHKFLTKWSKAYIEWKIQYKEWDDQEWNKKYMTEIVVLSVEFLTPKNTTNTQTQPQAEKKVRHEEEINIEDIPF